MLAPTIKQLIQAYQAPSADKPAVDEEVIKVDEIVSRLAFFYERLRNIVDYREDFLLRRAAIERILKRRLLVEGEDSSIAKPLILELVRAGYLPNGSLPVTVIQAVEEVLEKHLLLEYHVKASGGDKATLDWMRKLMASEVEDVLTPSRREDATVQLAYEVLKKKVVFDDKTISAEDREIQLWLAVYRHVLKSDYTRLTYVMWKLYYPYWSRLEEEKIQQIAQTIMAVRQAIDERVEHPSARQLNRIGHKYAAVFTIINDVFSKHAADLRSFYDAPEKLHLAITEMARSRYQQTRARISTSIVHAILYLFCTKFVLALIIEAPFEKFYYKEINYSTLITNIAFHPILMAVIALTIRVPSDKNTEKLIKEIHEILYNQLTDEAEKVVKPVKRRWFYQLFFNLLYLLMFGVTFGLLAYLLDRLNFNLVSGSLFVLFLSLVSYFGIRLRRSAGELVILEPKRNLLTVLFDFVSIPILTVGQWLSKNFSRFNIFIFVLDILIEAPFKLLIEVMEEWLGYIKEKREELY